MQKTMAGATNVQQAVSGTIMAGTYIISIRTPLFDLQLPASNYSYCLLFIWDLQIVPDSGLPYISDVAPDGGDNLNPQATLDIEVTFSEPIYNPQGQLVSSANSGLVKSAFYLLGSAEGNSIAPTSVEMTSAQNNIFWHLLFPAVFHPKENYQLKFNRGFIKNQQGDNIQLISTHIYRMIDTSCGGQGVYDRGYCFCNNGYAGAECGACNTGFINTSPTSYPVCVEQPSDKCSASTCSCDPLIVGRCEKLGDCLANGTCVCHPRFAGAHCEICAPTYTNWELGCRPSKTCACVRGVCNEATGICACPDHYGGSRCDECATGWSGTNCESEINTTGSGGDSGWTKAFSTIRIIGIVFCHADNCWNSRVSVMAKIWKI